MPKPTSCIGCPFYLCDSDFVPDKVVPGSAVMFMGQNPGQSEVEGHKLLQRRWIGGGEYIDEVERVDPQPLVGATGQMFDARYLPLTGLQRSEVSLGNVIRCRPGRALHLKSNELPPIVVTMKLEDSKAPIVQALRHCQTAHFHPPESTKVVVAMGRYAQFALTGIQQQEGKGQGVVESWRGYALATQDFKALKTIDVSHYHPLAGEKVVYITMHPASLFEGRNKRYMHATLSDFAKLKLLLEGAWPLPLPAWSDRMPQVWPAYAAFDTEYTVPGNELIRWSLCSAEGGLWCVEAAETPLGIVPVQAGSTVVLQNALADIEHLGSILGNLRAVRLEDMMLAHSVLWTGEPHSLNYIASMYGPINKHKHLSEDQQQLYSALDAYVPMYMWRSHFIPEFKKDLESWNVYRRYRMPLLKIIAKAQRVGVAIDNTALRQVRSAITSRMDDHRERAKELTGDIAFRLGAYRMVQRAIYDLETD